MFRDEIETLENHFSWSSEKKWSWLSLRIPGIENSRWPLMWTTAVCRLHFGSDLSKFIHLLLNLQHRFVESQENGLFDFLTKYQPRHSWSRSLFYYFHFQGTICLPVLETSASVWLVKLHFGRWSIKHGNCLQIIKLRGKWWMAGCIVSKLWINALPTKEVSHFRGNRICLASLPPSSLPHVAWKASKCIMLHFYH